MRFLLVLSLLAPILIACPMHGTPDFVAAEQSIEHANLRKRAERPWSHHNSKKIAITNVHIFDGFKYHEEISTVVVDGGVIGTDVTGATIIDGNGGTLMPGLIDNHNHPSTLADLRNLTSYGVTTTMGMSCWQASDQCASLRSQPGLTDFFSAGLSAIVPNSSHSRLALTNPAVQAAEYFIYNSSMCENWVMDRIKDGSDFIKLVAESDNITMTQEEHDIIVKTAKKHGYLTTTHTATTKGYETAVLSNTSIIQHTAYDGLISNETIKQILAQKQIVTPTVNIFQYIAKAQNLTATVAAKLNQIIEVNVKQMYKAGVPILVGTDASINSNGPAIIYFGSSMHQEMEMLSQFGLRNLDILKGATSRVAAAYNLEDRGVIEPGKRADLLLISGNPLVNVSATRNIEKVWVAGVEYTG